MLTALRKNQRSTTLRVLAALALVWLNMVLQPCAMALGATGDHHCPHCPPAQHCDDQATARCSFIDSIDSDGRTHQARIPDFSDHTFILPATQTIVRAPVVQSLAIASDFHATGPPATPLYIRYCAYLK